MKKTNSKQPSVRVRLLQSKEFGKVKVVSDKHFKGYVCLNDLCSILNLPKQQFMENLTGASVRRIASRYQRQPA